MPTVFDRAWSAAAGVLDKHFGEQFELLPVQRAAPGARIDVNARTTRDTSRPPVVFVGIWGLKAAERFPNSRGHANSDAQEFTSGLAMIEYETASMPLRPQALDRVRRVQTNTLYEITDAGEDVLGRRTLKLTARRG